MLPCQCWGQRGPVFFNTVNRTLNGLVYDGSGRIVMRSVKDGWISIWSDGEPRGIDLVRFDASTTPLVRHARAITALAVDRTDGDRLVWMEADDQGGFGFAKPTLWAAAYAPSEYQIKVSRVANTPAYQTDLWVPGSDMVANAGVILHLVSPKLAYVTRQSDGMSWSIAPEPNDIFVKPLWVDDRELWIEIADEVIGRTKPTGVFRFSRSSLGVPTIQPNL